ncbi:MAG: hypothetical protein OXF74_03205 [Rhodobacteraceae bacterium]|nr:hypothetical protein [Paracoccaceae bacterium]
MFNWFSTVKNLSENNDRRITHRIVGNTTVFIPRVADLNLLNISVGRESRCAFSFEVIAELQGNTMLLKVVDPGKAAGPMGVHERQDGETVEQ